MAPKIQKRLGLLCTDEATAVETIGCGWFDEANQARVEVIGIAAQEDLQEGTGDLEFAFAAGVAIELLVVVFHGEREVFEGHLGACEPSLLLDISRIGHREGYEHTDGSGDDEADGAHGHPNEASRVEAVLFL
jgi:hypothetical protein